MRLVLILTLLLSSVVPTRAAEVEFLRVWPGWRGAESFDRISEYFGGREDTDRNRVFRTQSVTRAGYYFLVRVRSSAALDGTTFELKLIRPDTPETKTHRFPVAVPAKETVFQFGLTGSDWPGGEEAHPVAWKLALFAADGRVLAEQKSFLWEKPAK